MPSGIWMSAEYQVLVTRRLTNDKDHAAYCTTSIYRHVNHAPGAWPTEILCVLQELRTCLLITMKSFACMGRWMRLWRGGEACVTYSMLS